MLKNKKGITPIISVILLLMMTIAIAGLAYTWLQRMQTTIQTSSENTSERLLGGLNVALRIEGYYANCTIAGAPTNLGMWLYVRNSGTQAANNVQLYVDDALQSGQFNSSLPAGTTTAYSGGVLFNISCSDWINATRVIKVSSDETTAEKSITFSCSTGSC